MEQIEEFKNISQRMVKILDLSRSPVGLNFYQKVKNSQMGQQYLKNTVTVKQ